MEPSVRHWHVTITVAGAPIEPLMARAAVQRLADERPFLDGVTAGADSAEIRFWDEGDTMLDVASLAMRLWAEHRESANLPDWEVVGLEVVEKSVRERRAESGRRA